ncbi:hypothetical protein [Agromyces sp. NPDC049794]|uniref:hypothetical protein n=1 Tax=unclassified Agromyces TaxID=2639701 RepID=UPI0033CA7F6E
MTRLLHVALLVYLVVIVATLAGSLGAYFLEMPVHRRREAPATHRADGEDIVEGAGQR